MVLYSIITKSLICATMYIILKVAFPYSTVGRFCNRSQTKIAYEKKNGFYQELCTTAIRKCTEIKVRRDAHCTTLRTYISVQIAFTNGFEKRILLKILFFMCDSCLQSFTESTNCGMLALGPNCSHGFQKTS